MMHHGFISQMEYLGDGETVDNFIHNYDKTNQVSRLETKSFCNHHNPHVDTSAHLGMNLLLHFCVLYGPFPDFLDGEDYTKRPVFRSISSYHSEYPSSSQNPNWNSLFKVCGINCDKVTHQQRQQLQQKLVDAGLDLMHLERFIGYASTGQKQMNGNQLHSYLFNSPVQAVADAADGDPNSPSTFISGWDATTPPTDLSTLCPWLWNAISKVEKAMAQFTDPKDQARHCLIQAQGSLLPLSFASPALSNFLRRFQWTTRIIFLLMNPQSIFAGHITPFCLIPFLAPKHFLTFVPEPSIVRSNPPFLWLTTPPSSRRAGLDGKCRRILSPS
jgi:hypothetical protein